MLPNISIVFPDKHLTIYTYICGKGHTTGKKVCKIILRIPEGAASY